MHNGDFCRRGSEASPSPCLTRSNPKVIHQFLCHYVLAVILRLGSREFSGAGTQQRRPPFAHAANCSDTVMMTVRQGHRSQAAFDAERWRKVTPWCVRQRLPDHPDFHHSFAIQNILTPAHRPLPLKLPCDSHSTVIDRRPGTTPSHVSNPPNLRIFSASLPGGMIRTCLLTKRAFFCKVHGTGGSAPGAQLALAAAATVPLHTSTADGLNHKS